MSDRKNNQVPKDLVHKWYEARPTVFYNYLAFTKSPRVQVSQPKSIQWAENPKILPKTQPIQTHSLFLGIILGYFHFGYPILTLHKIFYDSGWCIFAKGQLISKQNCRAITSPKKQTLDFYF